MQLLEEAIESFRNVFGETPTAFGLAPGRVEVLGNHTDYNEGFILSAAIDRYVVLVGRAVEGEKVRIYSQSFRTGDTFSLSSIEKTRQNFWLNYVKGVLVELQRRGIALGGVEALIVGDVPLGAGLSSSAALEVATARLIQQLYPFSMDPVEMALLCQAAENRFVGVNCGILDQFSSLMGKADHLVFLDCRDLRRYDHLPLGADMALVLAHTHASHTLADGTYNRLREDCFEAARRLAEITKKPITHLRDVSVEMITQYGSLLPDAIHRRARHVVTENARVLRGVEALRKGDRETMGQMMLESHASSRDDFGNSCEELDGMVECAKGLPGFHGGRLSGGGFGGCTVNLVDAEKATAFSAELSKRYRARSGIEPTLYICKPVEGAKGGSLAG